jgi:hypothetical protein
MIDDSGTGTGASLDTLAQNRAGRASALTALTPLPRRWSPLVRAVLKAKAKAGPDKTLRRLSFIHAAHWVLIDEFPGRGGRLRYSYLLFTSNFNGSWFDYIDAFSTAVPLKMALIWGSSFGFPGANPPKGFTDYIRDVDQPMAHYYAAYPEATTTEIASALRVRDLLRADLRPALAAGDPASADDTAAVARAWRTFLTQAQRDL